MKKEKSSENHHGLLLKDSSGRSIIKDLLIAAAAALLTALNVNSFVNSGGLVPGGFSGISLNIVRIAAKYFNTEVSYSILYALFNIPCALLVFRYVSKRFTMMSLVYVGLVSLGTHFIPKFEITDDLLLISIFGGIVSGAAGAMMLYANGCCGGTDFISIYFAKKKHRSVWNEIFAVNCVMLVIAGYLFGWESALYSIIYQFAGTQMVKTFDTRYKRSSFIIISDKAQDIAHAVYEKYHHSVTIFDAVGGYTGNKKTVLYTVVGDYEVNKLLNTIFEIDPKAFINVDNSQRVVGNFHEKPF